MNERVTVEFRLIPSPDQGQGGERDRTYDDKGPWDANGTRRVTTRHHAGKRPHDLSGLSLSACAFAQVLADFVQRFGHIYESSRKEIKRKECRLYCLGLFNYQRIFGWVGSVDGGCIHCMALGLTPSLYWQGRTPDRTIQFQPECWIPRQYQY
ncbi:hypothetical protein BO83DRAFT_412954 [Aspergillus eucalypticola CBS 122712]|uniref:Uncharacterized protein n=1 Tax=Aspergillus eucalypticola (strain CBS 122712 / IBT 29274) TaxID=1448314 RepID=A0A317UJF8_ASPEC|nr:uncharacterized protein BO83DRAFT_412954 [Aspergillus eucalypticola CBS 122712]PWY61821.1 hypothetical protein BO83DRAFT_412954 [Aspergillus eucalypticola CBS 122712]